MIVRHRNRLVPRTTEGVSTPVFIRTCTRRPLVCLPSARRRPAGRGGPQWVHPFPQEPADRNGGEPGGEGRPGEFPDQR